MLRGILILVLFLLIIALMVTKKMPTLIALPILAVGIAIIAGVPMMAVNENGENIGWLHTVIESGSTRMSSAYIAVIFGAWLGRMMNSSGVTESIITKAAELGGDRPILITIILTIVTALLFTTLAGLGSIIMVGSIVLPILVTVGIPAISAASIFLMAFATGLTFNLSNWQTYSSIFNVDVNVIRSFSMYLFVLTLIATIILIIVEFKKNGIKFAFSAPIEENYSKELKGIRGVLAMLTPIIPIVLVAIFDFPIVSAFIAGIIWISIFTFDGWNKTINMITKSCYDGFSDSAPAVILMVGIGMLFLSVTNATVMEVLNPIISIITPKSKMGYIFIFILLAPLALYRGPFNLFGLGSGIAALMIGLDVLPLLAIVAAFLSVERIQAVGDPTNTQNVWTANYVGVEVNTITKKLIPYLWAITAIGILIAASLYF